MTHHSEKPSWPYYVDEESKQVWMEVDSWMRAQAAPHLVKHFFGPDYTHKLTTLEKIAELNDRA